MDKLVERKPCGCKVYVTMRGKRILKLCNHHEVQLLEQSGIIVPYNTKPTSLV